MHKPVRQQAAHGFKGLSGRQRHSAEVTLTFSSWPEFRNCIAGTAAPTVHKRKGPLAPRAVMVIKFSLKFDGYRFNLRFEGSCSVLVRSSRSELSPLRFSDAGRSACQDTRHLKLEMHQVRNALGTRAARHFDKASETNPRV